MDAGVYRIVNNVNGKLFIIQLKKVPMYQALLQIK